MENKKKPIMTIEHDKEEKKERKVSVSYTIKQFKNMIEKLEEAKMINAEEKADLTKHHTNIVKRWLGLEMEL